MSIKTVYVVESGLYDDYGVYHAYKNEEHAKQACEILNRNARPGGDEFDYRALEVYTTAPEVVEILQLTCRVEAGGAIIGATAERQVLLDAFVSETVKPVDVKVSHGIDFVWICVRGTDAEGVEKSYHDTIAAVRAEQ